MAWTSPKTWVAGAILPASEMNTYVRDNTDYLKTEVDSHHKLAGSSTTYAKSGGALYATVTATASVSTTKTTLWTMSIPANTLSADKQSLTGEVWVTFAANANNKRVEIEFGSTAVVDTGTINPNGGTNRYWFTIARTGAATQVAHGAGLGTGLSSLVLSTATTPTETLSGAVTLKVSGTGVDTNDIVIRHGKVWWHPAGN